MCNMQLNHNILPLLYLVRQESLMTSRRQGGTAYVIEILSIASVT